MKTDGAKEADMKGFKKDTSFIGLSKLAIDFADGVIQGSENIAPELLEYVASKPDKPFLPYQAPDIYMDKFNEFYDVILENK